MGNLYYMIWADAISRMRQHHPNKRDWKIILLMYLSWIHAINGWIVFIWMRFFGLLSIPLIQLDIFPGTLLDGVLAFTIQFALPFIVANYFLIFYKNRYQSIIERYKSSRFRFALVYSFSILVLAFATAIFYGTSR